MTVSQNVFHRAVYLTGPTASGKTAVGVELARRLDAEVVALDSMTLYRGMDVGTAKPTEEERGGVPHHLIDVFDPWESASVAAYRELARNAADAIEGRGRRVLFVGGTALYLKALLRGLFDGPPAEPELRQVFERDAETLGDQKMHERLQVVDPASAARLHPNDRRRVIRALEVSALTGRPLSEWQREHDRPAPKSVAVLALERPREELYERINRRVVAMFEARLIDEVRGLLDAPQGLHSVPAQAVGYREVIDLLAGRASLEDTVERVQTRTRQFAKRQMTWFRGLSEVQLHPLSGDKPPSAIAQRIAAGLT